MKRLLGGLVFLALICWPRIAGADSQSGQLVTVGILPFHDESGAQASPEFLRRVVQEFRRQLASSFKDVLPRTLSGEMPGAPAAMSVEQLASVGRQQGVRFVVRGGLLAAVSEKRGRDLECRLEFFCDLIDAGSLAVSSFRAEGSGLEKNTSLASALNWDPIDWDNPEFGHSALGQALASSLAGLSEQIHVSATTGPQLAGAMDARPGPVPPAEDSTGDPYQLDQDLQQVIAQADALISGGAASSLGDITPLQQSLEGLLSAMDSKLKLLEEAQDTASVDLDIRQRQEELQGLVDGYTQQFAEAPPPQDYAEDAPAEKSALTSTLQELLQSALTSLLNIQNIRAALGLQDEGAQNAYAGGDEYADPGAGDYAYAEEPPSDICGFVYDEAGNPVEGATVLETETGAEAVTDGGGSYMITGVPGGRIAMLRVVSGGRTVATGRADVPPRGTGIADWQVGAGARGSTPSASKIIPSSCIAKNAGSRSKTGTIQGVVLDDKGKAVARALVMIKGVGAARTDSGGRYTFVQVPQGGYDLSIQRSGSAPLTQKIKLAGLQTLRPRTVFAKTALRPVAKANGRVLVGGENTRISGKVADARGKALARSKVTLLYPGGALVAYANERGTYEFRDLKQGKYRVLAAKSGYADSAATVEVKKNGTTVRDFKLSESSSAAVRKAVSSRDRPRTAVATSESARVSSPKNKSTPVPPKNASGSTKSASSKAVQVQPAVTKGEVRGTVLDGKTGKPIPGATVILKGKPGAKTDGSGRFQFADLAPGAHSVSVKRAGFKDGSDSFTIKAGGTTSLRIRLTPLATVKPATPAIRKS